jgi:hypothetical protein
MSKVKYSKKQREILNDPKALAAIVRSHGKLTETFTHNGKTYRVVPFHSKRAVVGKKEIRLEQEKTKENQAQ